MVIKFQKIKIRIIVFFALLSGGVFGQERVILNLTDQPATSMAVTWRSQQDGDSSYVRFAQATQWTDFEDGERIAMAKKELVVMDGDSVFHYSAIMDHLEPNTTYVYSVGGDHDWSEWNQFKTADNKASPFSFVFFGDPQNDIRQHVSRVFRQAFRQSPDARFWLFVGDLISMPQYDRGWDELFYAGGSMFRMTPSVMIPGNHEYMAENPDKTKYEHFTSLWKPHFTLPENGVMGMEEKSYFFDYQGVRFIMLDSNENLDLQVEWMQKLLADNPNTWTIVAFHHPVYDIGRNRNSTTMQEIMLPLLDKYSVDLVLQGHDHAYGRTAKMKNGKKVPDSDKGTVYVVSVSGPKSYPLNEDAKEKMEVAATNVMLYQTINMDKNQLSFKAYTVDGKLFDSFELKK